MASPDTMEFEATDCIWQPVAIPAHFDITRFDGSKRRGLPNSIKQDIVKVYKDGRRELVAEGCRRGVLMSFSQGIRMLAKDNPATEKAIAVPESVLFDHQLFRKVYAWFISLCSCGDMALLPALQVTPGSFEEAYVIFKTFSFLKLDTGVQRMGDLLRDYIDIFPLQPKEFALVSSSMSSLAPLKSHMIRSTVTFWYYGFDDYRYDIERWIARNESGLQRRLELVRLKTENVIRTAHEIQQKSKESQNAEPLHRSNPWTSYKAAPKSYAVASALGHKKTNSTSTDDSQVDATMVEAARDGSRALDESEVEYLLGRK